MVTENVFGYGYSASCKWENLPTWLQGVASELPHGSGIDYDWTFYVQKNKTVVFSNEYHGMDENGFYVCSIPFSVKVDPKKPLDFRVVFHTKNRYWVQTWDLENYLPEILYDAIAKFTPVRVPCGFCKGTGWRSTEELSKARHEPLDETRNFLIERKAVFSGASEASFRCWTCEGTGKVKA